MARLVLRLIFLPLLLSPIAAAPSFAGGDFTVTSTVVKDMKAVFATVETANVITARARIGGTLTKLSVDDGSWVKKGQVIGMVRDAKLKLRMDALKARIQSVKSQRKLARTDLQRARKLRRSGTIAQQRLDEIQTALDVIERQYVALKADLSVISQQQAEGVVLAPAGGRVTRVKVTEGVVLMPGEAVATIAAKGYFLRLRLPERHAGSIRQGDLVQIRDNRVGALTIGRVGRIKKVYPELRQGRVIADVAVKGLDNYFIGERVSVYVSTGKRRTIIVPAGYTFLRYGLTFVRLKDGGDIVVQPGQPTPGGEEILSGLNPGDVLVKTNDE